MRGTNEIAIESGNEPAQQLKTLIHETAHAMFDHGSVATSYAVGELEAESTAYLVCDAIGIDSSEYSFHYLANWSEDPEKIFGAADRAAKVAQAMIDALAIETKTA